jgi:hypothetical protein
MKKVTRKIKQTLSILLAVAMVITMIPQNTLSVSAANDPDADTKVVSETADPVIDENQKDTDVSETEVTDETKEESSAEGGEVVEEDEDQPEAADEENHIQVLNEENLEEDIVETQEDPTTYTVAVSATNATVKVGGTAVQGSSTTAPENKNFDFTVEPSEGYKITAVEYYATASGDSAAAPATKLTSDSTVTYRVPAAAMKENVTVKVTVAELAKPKATFAAGGSSDNLDEITLTNLTDYTDYVNTGSDTSANIKSNGITVTEGESVKFWAEIDDESVRTR